jgi:hypothetical protein
MPWYTWKSERLLRVLPQFNLKMDGSFPRNVGTCVGLCVRGVASPNETSFIKNFLIVRFSSVSCYFLLLRRNTQVKHLLHNCHEPLNADTVTILFCLVLPDILRLSKIFRTVSAIYLMTSVRNNLDRPMYIRKCIKLFDVSQDSPACPSSKSTTKIKMTVVRWWKDADRKK